MPSKDSNQRSLFGRTAGGVDNLGHGAFSARVSCPVQRRHGKPRSPTRTGIFESCRNAIKRHPSTPSSPHSHASPLSNSCPWLSGNTPRHSRFALCRYRLDQKPGAHLLHTRMAYPRPNVMHRWLRASDHLCDLPVVGSAQRASRSSAGTRWPPEGSQTSGRGNIAIARSC